MFTVTRNRKPPEEIDRVVRDGGRGPGVNIRSRAQLERHPPVADERGETPEVHRAVLADLDVIDDPDAMAEALGAGELEGLPDRGQAERFPGMDRDVEVLAADVVERVQVAASADSPSRVPQRRTLRHRHHASGRAASATSTERAAWRIAVTRTFIEIG